jgi:hypothetical protein
VSKFPDKVCFYFDLTLHLILNPISGGWDPETGTLQDGIEAQIDQAFKNVEPAFMTVGGAGWLQVYRITSYHVGINGEVQISENICQTTNLCGPALELLT